MSRLRDIFWYPTREEFDKEQDILKNGTLEERDFTQNNIKNRNKWNFYRIVVPFSGFTLGVADFCYNHFYWVPQDPNAFQYSNLMYDLGESFLAGSLVACSLAVIPFVAKAIYTQNLKQNRNLEKQE
ncbi:MAG: hypothetical protein ABIF40_01990 [archaeon]